MTRLYVSLVGVIGTAMMLAGNALATVDPVLQNASDDITDYFTENIVVIIGAVIVIVLALWLLGMLFRSTGATNKKKVG